MMDGEQLSESEFSPCYTLWLYQNRIWYQTL
jgi:hypothetical protein